MACLLPLLRVQPQSQLPTDRFRLASSWLCIACVGELLALLLLQLCRRRCG
jgi:hypothetical protein